MSRPDEILENVYEKASARLNEPFIEDKEVQELVKYVASNIKNRAGVRLLMACLLAKIHNPEVDVRKPYTEIGDNDCFSGRTYDERYITAFINRHKLPCNNTTAFLTPALRNRNITLTIDVDLVGRPSQLYKAILRSQTAFCLLNLNYMKFLQ